MDTPILDPTEQIVAEALRNQLPVTELPGVSIQIVREQPKQPFDISFEIRSGPNQTPRLCPRVAPWR